MENAEFRTCTKCEENKELFEFPRQSKKRGGYETRCKKCKFLYLKEYRENPKNLEVSRKHKSAWKKKNRAKANLQQNNRRNERRKVDPEYKLIQIVRNRLGEVLNSKGILKTRKTMKYMGCSSYELLQHIEDQFTEGMSWENHGQFGWHVDHIKPLASFDLSDLKQQEEAFHYTNLRPLWWKENLARNKEKIKKVKDA